MEIHPQNYKFIFYVISSYSVADHPIYYNLKFQGNSHSLRHLKRLEKKILWHKKSTKKNQSRTVLVKSQHPAPMSKKIFFSIRQRILWTRGSIEQLIFYLCWLIFDNLEMISHFHDCWYEEQNKLWSQQEMSHICFLLSLIYVSIRKGTLIFKSQDFVKFF